MKMSLRTDSSTPAVVENITTLESTLIISASSLITYPDLPIWVYHVAIAVVLSV